MENIDEKIKESATKGLNPKRMGGVWCVLGSPITLDGLTGAERAEVFLLPMGAEAAEAREAFVNSCNECDAVKYSGAKLLSVRFVGQVRIPSEENSRLWAIAPTVAALSIP